jgi:hypothetical protein
MWRTSHSRAEWLLARLERVRVSRANTREVSFGVPDFLPALFAHVPPLKLGVVSAAVWAG